MPLPQNVSAFPDKIATIMARSGESVTFRELDDRSRRLASLWREAGLGPGDVVALFMENNIRYHEVYWAAVRSGMYLCAVNKYLTAEEATYIVNDSGAKAFVTSAALADVVADMVGHIPNCPLRLAVDGPVAGCDVYETAIAAASNEAAAHEQLGDFMNYSSGTTGRPKGIKRPLTGRAFIEPSNLDGLCKMLYGFDTETTYLSPAPLYHSAPLAFTASVHSLGGTVVIMEKFDPKESLKLIEQHKVTHSQWVPTMFVKMLKLDPVDHLGHDLSSHTVAVHAAAPCPIEVKRQMLDWWGPIICEYYGGTELNGMTFCNSAEWLAHPGTVGKPILGKLHICDEAGVEVANATPGVVFFEREEMPFRYHNDPGKTDSARHPDHPLWTKLGDVGYVDDDGYLYLTDRESFMIMSGGVNIYPQEIEDCIVMHPKVADVAVFGVPNEMMGEEVKAVVQLAPGVEGSDALANEILEHAKLHIAAYKVPRSVDFVTELPRLETGKLYKRLLRDRYWGNHTSKIV